MQGFRKVICITQYIIFFLIFTSNSIFSEPTGDEFTLKLLKRTGENFFSNLAYECNDCTFEQFEALKPPRGWSKSPKQIIIPKGKLESHLTLDGVPSTLDFISEIPGNEFKLIAKSIEGKIVKFGFNGIMVKSKVIRQTILHYPAGSRVHELTDSDGNIFVLFAYEVESVDFDRSYFQNIDAMANYPYPRGWVYSSRIINENLELNSNGIATVLAIRAKPSSVWEKR